MVHTKVAPQPCDASVNGSVFERFSARENSLGTLRILRALPFAKNDWWVRGVFSIGQALLNT